MRSWGSCLFGVARPVPTSAGMVGKSNPLVKLRHLLALG
jgi:hypothetical protein